MNMMDDTKGFTLIEVLIAVVVFAIGILSLYTMQIVSMKVNSNANNMTRAAIAASDTVEQLMQLGFNDSELDDNAANNPHDDSEVASLVLPDSVSSIVWNVVNWSSDGTDNDGDSSVDEPDESGMKQVNVTVNYVSFSTAKQVAVQFLKIEL